MSGIYRSVRFPCFFFKFPELPVNPWPAGALVAEHVRWRHWSGLTKKVTPAALRQVEKGGKRRNARKCILLRIGLGMYQFFMMFWYLLIIFTFLSTGVASADFKVVTDWPQGSSVGQLWGQLSLCSGEIHAGASYFPSSLLWVRCVQCRPSHIILLIITRYMNAHWPIWTLLG